MLLLLPLVQQGLEAQGDSGPLRPAEGLALGDSLADSDKPVELLQVRHALLFKFLTAFVDN